MKRDPTKHFLELIAMAIEGLSNRTSLVTVTKGELSENGKSMTVGISVLPEKEEAKVLDFLERNNEEIYQAMRTGIKSHRVPHLRFVSDKGEKNRQRIHELLSSDLES